MADALSNCPYCGSERKWQRHGFHTGRWFIRCPNMECNLTYAEDEKEAAIVAANKRHEQAGSYADLVAEVERLRVYIELSADKLLAIVCSDCELTAQGCFECETKTYFEDYKAKALTGKEAK